MGIVGIVLIAATPVLAGFGYFLFNYASLNFFESDLAESAVYGAAIACFTAVPVSFIAGIFCAVSR